MAARSEFKQDAAAQTGTITSAIAALIEQRDLLVAAVAALKRTTASL